MLGLSGVFYLMCKEVWDFVLVIGVGCILGFVGSVCIWVGELFLYFLIVYVLIMMLYKM